jgi:membrane protease YdiL (CAAX protease family)
VFADAAATDHLHELDALLALFWSWLGLAVAGGGVLLGIWLLAPGTRGPLLPPQRHRAVPWSFLHIALVVFVGELWREACAALFDPPGKNLKATLAAWPLQVASIIFLLRQYAGARLYQLGLSAHRLLKDLSAGFLFWLVLTPIVFGVYILVLVYEQPQLQELEKLLEQGPASPAWWLAALGVLILAPVLEELLFRGVIQRWMVESPMAADLVLLIALLWAIVRGANLASWGPLLFLATVGPGYLAFEYLMRPWLPRPGAARAIYATSLLFAAGHAGAWPTPIPLFVLALGLGFLAYRTQTLIGPMLAHGLFNAVSLLQVLLQPLVKA